MSSINLIPEIYISEQRNRRVVKRAAAFCIGVLVITAFAIGAIQVWMHYERTPRGVPAAHEDLVALQKRIQDLTSRKTTLEKDAALMDKVQANPDITAIINALEITLNSDVWINELHYARQQELLDAAACAAFEHLGAIRYVTGVPGQPEQCWKQERVLNVKAAAMGHQAMGKFLQTLGRHPGFTEARFVSSTADTTDQGDIVEFAVHVRMGIPERAPAQ